MKTAVVVERGAPKHCSMSHHATWHVLRFNFMTCTAGTRLTNNPQVTRINKANKLPTLASQQRVSSFRISAGVLAVALPLAWIRWSHVGQFFYSLNLTRFVTCFPGDRVATVTRCAT